MTKLTLSNIANALNDNSTVSTINSNNDLIETALENTLSRDGTSPNTMSANLDMNSNRIVNLPAPVANTDAARFQDIGDAVTASEEAEASATAAAASAASAAGYATNASNSASAALTSETNAASSASDADASADAAAASVASLADGRVIRYGAGAPSNGLGNDGDFYINTSTNYIYGPKASGTWPAGTSLVGPAGADGEMTGPGVSVDSEIAVYNGTSGATLKRANQTGILKATSGVIGTATASTDYAPATSGTSILKGNGSGGFSNASAGTDYQGADAELTAIAGLTSAADRLPYFTGSGTAALATFTAAGRALVDDADASAQKTTLGLGTSDNPQFATIELGAASDTTLSRASAGTLAVEGVNVLTTSTGAKLAGAQNLTGGFTTTSYSAGTKSTGTFTPDPTLGNIQHYTNGGAHTLAPPSSVCTMILECTNSSAGAITTSGFSIVSGDTFSSTGTKKHIFYITKTNSYSQLHVQYVTGT